LEPVARRLIEQTRDLHSRYLSTQAALNVLSSLFASWSPVAKAADLARFRTDADERAADATAARWRDALAVLRENAAAALPPIED
jgi:hypothetical protein